MAELRFRLVRVRADDRVALVVAGLAHIALPVLLIVGIVLLLRENRNGLRGSSDKPGL